MLHAAILRSPHAHARITRIDYSTLRDHGVLCALTGEDASQLSRGVRCAGRINLEEYCLASGEVVYVGQPVVAVVAEDKYTAEDALDLVRVEYEALPAASEDHASHTRDNVTFAKTFRYGDLDSAFPKFLDSDTVIVRDSFTYESYSAMPLETFGVLADYKSGSLHLYDNCQVPVHTISILSETLSIPKERIRITIGDIGGGFGIKGMTAQYDILISLLSKKLGRPVKWTETRSEHMMGSSRGSERKFDVEASVRKDGVIRGLRVSAREDVGAYFRPQSRSAVVSCLRSFCGPYRIDAFEYNVTVLLSNKCPAGPSRGNGKNHHSFLLERLMDRIAHELGVDPLALRRRNIITSDQFPYTTANGCVYDSGDYAGALNKAVSKLAESISPSKDRKIARGYALVVNPGASNSSQGRFFDEGSTALGTAEVARVSMDENALIKVTLGSVSTGQGHGRAVREIVSRMLSVNPATVTLEPGFESESGVFTNTSGTYSSRFAPIACSALVLACRELRTKLLAFAAKALKVQGGLEFRNGNISDRSGLEISLGELVGKYVSEYGETPNVTSVYSHSFGATLPKARRNLAATYSYEAHAALVVVDLETGKVGIPAYVVVDDSGKILDRAVVEGQVQGGVANGIAAALYERFLYDGGGRLLTTTFSDYLSPSAMDLPRVEVSLLENPSPFTLSGAKGVGESGALGPQPAILNALESALGIRIESSHVTPESIRRLLRERI